MKVLILAMEKRSALAAARSLGRKGVEVIGCSHEKRNPGFYSKYCSKKYVYCSPFIDAKKYLEDIFGIIEKEKPDVLMPVNEETILPLLEKREQLEAKIKFPLPPNEILEKVFDKLAATEIARKIEIPYPKLVEAHSPDPDFPIIARPRCSRRIENGRIAADDLFYIKSKKELKDFDSGRFFLQEHIPGQGYGFYALFDRGNPVAYFMMKRIHEVPFTGGPSSLRESIWDDKLKDYGLRILKELDWHGLAMVEFRKDERDGEFKFIEINGRLWGSLALSIDAGIDFPYLLCQMAAGQKLKEQFKYKIGVRGRWLAGDISYLLSVFFGKGVDGRPSRIKSFLEFFNFFQRNMSYDYFSKDDLKPALMDLLFSFIKLFKKICKSRD